MTHLQQLKGKTLLIVEDEDDLREPLAMEFESLGCKVFEARNGIEGFAIVSAQHIDLVISDIRMPGGDGIEMLKKIKAKDFHVPVVMLITGFSDMSREETYHLGAEAILSKPFELDEIESAVDRLLQSTQVRWAQPAPICERGHLERAFKSLPGAAAEGMLGLGRGGLFLARGKDENTVGTLNRLVSFHIKFEEGDLLLIEGTGTVRWVRSVDAGGFAAGVGIEFDTLSDQCRNDVLEVVRTLRTKAYLPRDSQNS